MDQHPARSTVRPRNISFSFFIATGHSYPTMPFVSPWIYGTAAVVSTLSVAALASNRSGSNKKRRSQKREASDEYSGTDPDFVCERVCTTNRLMRRMGGLAKDITPNTCVTVCGVSALDSCTEACSQAVCTSMHQVPAWNEACITRCSTECQRGRGV